MSRQSPDSKCDQGSDSTIFSNFIISHSAPSRPTVPNQILLRDDMFSWGNRGGVTLVDSSTLNISSVIHHILQPFVHLIHLGKGLVFLRFDKPGKCVCQVVQQ